MLKELGFGRLLDSITGIVAIGVLSRTKKIVVDDDGGIVSHELRDVGTLDHSSLACFLIPLVAHGISLQMVADNGIAGIVLCAPAQAVIEDEYMVIDDPEKRCATRSRRLSKSGLSESNMH